MNKLIHEKYEEPLDVDNPEDAPIIDKLRKTSMQILEKVENNHKKNQIKSGLSGDGIV